MYLEKKLDEVTRKYLAKEKEVTLLTWRINMLIGALKKLSETA